MKDLKERLWPAVRVALLLPAVALMAILAGTGAPISVVVLVAMSYVAVYMVGKNDSLDRIMDLLNAEKEDSSDQR